MSPRSQFEHSTSGHPRYQGSRNGHGHGDGGLVHPMANGPRPIRNYGNIWTQENNPLNRQGKDENRNNGQYRSGQTSGQYRNAQYHNSQSSGQCNGQNNGQYRNVQYHNSQYRKIQYHNGQSNDDQYCNGQNNGQYRNMHHQNGQKNGQNNRGQRYVQGNCPPNKPMTGRVNRNVQKIVNRPLRPSGRRVEELKRLNWVFDADGDVRMAEAPSLEECYLVDLDPYL